MKMKDYRIPLAQKLQFKLNTDEHIPLPYAAALTDDALNHFDERVREGVLLWVEGALPEDFGVDGATVAEIRNYYKISDFAALCFMDVYLKRPAFARRELEWMERRIL